MEVTIVIGNKGWKDEGVYIGRGKYSIFGNPFPVKSSKFSNKIYTLEESLNKYKKYLKEKIEKDKRFKKEFDKVVMILKKEKEIKLNCFCINKTINSLSDIDLNNCKCHGEILSWYLLKELEKLEE